MRSQLAASVCSQLLAATLVAGHGYVLDPPPRIALRLKGNVSGAAGTCDGGICFWFSQGCTIGCPKCMGDFAGTCGKNQGTATIPDYARTWMGGWHGRWLPGGNILSKKCGVMPWCAPGSSPILGPCGTAGGGTRIMPINQGLPPVGFKMGDDARILKELDGPKTIWKSGSVVEIQWTLAANHGGGYQYRLCPLRGEYAALTEECFQQTPIEFSGNEQYVQFCENANPSQFPPFNRNPEPFPACKSQFPRLTIPAVDVSNGTIPAGSTWRRNPIPGCINGVDGDVLPIPGNGCGLHDGKSPKDFMFPPPGSDPTRSQWGKLLGGYGAFDARTNGGNIVLPKKHVFQFNVVDKVIVPKVPPGEYVMSWRWEAEMAPQIWLSCSDVTIVAGDGPVPIPPAPATKYVCHAGKCTAGAGGIDLPTCEQACH